MTTRIRTYRLPDSIQHPTRTVVVHKELAAHLKFEATATRDSRHEFEMALRARASRIGGWKHGECIPLGRLVLGGQNLIEFNNLVYKDHGFRFPASKVTVYAAEGVAFILALLANGARVEDLLLLARLGAHPPEGLYESYLWTVQQQEQLFEPSPPKPSEKTKRTPPPPVVPKITVKTQAEIRERQVPVEELRQMGLLPAPSTVVVSPVATLSAVMVALHEWVKTGKMTEDLATRYLADYMQRNNVLDFTREPPELPPGLAGGGQKKNPFTTVPLTPADPATPAEVPTNGHTRPFKAGMRTPVTSALQIYREWYHQYGTVNLEKGGITDPRDIVALAKKLDIHEHSYWGKFDSGEWMYDTDAVRKLKEVFDAARLSKKQQPAFVSV